MKVNRVAEKICRIRYRMKYKNDPVNFLSLVDNPDDCLVCLPSNLKFVLNAASKLPDIATIFPNRLIKVLVTSNIDHRSHEYIKRFTMDKPYSYDITNFYLPKRSFIDRISGKGLSICIDLDFEHNFFNSAITVLTKAPLRIGCRKGMGLPYYNLEIDIGDKTVISPATYDNFIKVLYNFKNKGEKVAPVET
ncbi:MAG: hypothetical protein GY839_08505 [candidate division Zixibacteria bacterium]|nr:hypothetical protein [candidate division Zixibacteria bacterium]